MNSDSMPNQTDASSQRLKEPPTHPTTDILSDTDAGSDTAQQQTDRLSDADAGSATVQTAQEKGNLTSITDKNVTTLQSNRKNPRVAIQRLAMPIIQENKEVTATFSDRNRNKTIEVTESEYASSKALIETILDAFDGEIYTYLARNACSTSVASEIETRLQEVQETYVQYKRLSNDFIQKLGSNGMIAQKNVIDTDRKEIQKRFESLQSITTIVESIPASEAELERSFNMDNQTIIPSQNQSKLNDHSSNLHEQQPSVDPRMREMMRHMTEALGSMQQKLEKLTVSQNRGEALHPSRPQVPKEDLTLVLAPRVQQ